MAWTHTSHAQQVVLGAGAVRRLPELLRAVGARRVLLVTTEGRLASDDGDRVVRAIGALLASTFAGVEPHVPTSAVQAAHRQARQGAVDAVVSFGGGSSVDTAKAVCFFSEQEQGIPSTSWVDRPALPHVSLPTTYSGAALTSSFEMTDPSTRTKTAAAAPTCAPVAVAHDPELTLDLAPEASAAGGMDALAHCVEAVWSPARTPEAEALALAGAQRLCATLPLVVDDPGDVTVRTSVLEGAHLAGRALAGSAGGVHRGLTRLVGGRTGVPHGLASAVLLAHTLRFTAEAVPEAARRLGGALRDPDDPAGAVERLAASLGVPTRLGDVGVALEDIEVVARLAPADPDVAANPRPVTSDDAHAILLAAY